MGQETLIKWHSAIKEEFCHPDNLDSHCLHLVAWGLTKDCWDISYVLIFGV